MMSIFFRGANIFQNPPIVKHYNNGFPHGSFFISTNKNSSGYMPDLAKMMISQGSDRFFLTALTPMSGKVSEQN